MTTKRKTTIAMSLVALVLVATGAWAQTDAAAKAPGKAPAAGMHAPGMGPGPGGPMPGMDAAARIARDAAWVRRVVCTAARWACTAAAGWDAGPAAWARGWGPACAATGRGARWPC